MDDLYADNRNLRSMFVKRRIFYSFLLILWMGVIFYFSADEAQESSEKSMEVCEGICDVFVVGYDELPRQEQLHRAEQLNFSVRKAAHFLEYTMLGILLVLALAQYPVQRRELAAVGIGFLYAMTDEFHQLFVSGRSGQLSDVAIDTAGVVCGVLICMAGRMLVRRMQGKSADGAV